MKISAAALLIVLSVARLTAGDVRVRARTRPYRSLIFWPWDRGLVSTNANFTFIP
jgi:hypothetical protein